ncbi:MAG TPA: GTPase [Methylomirabilota bacterium]|nr:GTPase [Methylomirabilota bacterium]
MRVLILGAAGRDFHDFDVVYRDDPGAHVVAFTATQVPGIAGRRYPPELAGPRYPAGIPIEPEAALDRLVHEQVVDQVVFEYSDTSPEEVMHLASRALAAGADFILLGPRRTMLRASRPVVAVTAVRTGCGKSAVSGRIVRILRDRGRRVAVVRHPMPYGDLAAQRVQRFADPADLDRAGVTLEEREEYEPHLEAGSVVWAGVDYAAILARVETEADVIVWDGGNNDLPFFAPTLHLCLVDPHRAGHESRYHPGETNLRLADVAVIVKEDTASPASLEATRGAVHALNPRARVLDTRLPLSVETPEALAGRRVLAVDDGPTLTHGGLAAGAAELAARRFRRDPGRSPAVRAGQLADGVPDLPGARTGAPRPRVRSRPNRRPPGDDRGHAERGRALRHANRPEPGARALTPGRPGPVRRRGDRPRGIRRGPGRPVTPTHTA